MTAQHVFARRSLLALAAAFAVTACANAQALTGPALIKALQSGGYVLVVRHASSPQAPPTAELADPGNTGPERQLDEAGKQASAQMGRAIRTLRLPIGEVLSSPAFRARQTVQLAELQGMKTAPELSDRGQSMAGVSPAQAEWLRDRLRMPTASGSNTMLVTHLPNINAAFGAAVEGVAEGESLVFRAGAAGQPAPMARIRIEAWPELAAMQP